MDYTLDTLKSILRKRLQDEEFDDDLLTQFLNDAMNDILGEDKYPFMQRIDQYTADEAGEVSLPLGYGGTFYVYARREGEPRQELEYIAPEDFFKRTGARRFCYTIFANTLFYRISKDTDGDGFTVTHLYLENPRSLKDGTDRPPIPAQFMEILILGALWRAEQVRDNFDYAQLYQNQQDQLQTNMKLRYGPGNLTAKNRAKLPFYGGRHYDS